VKKYLSILAVVAILLQMTQCSSIMSALNPKARICRTACNTVYDKCVQKYSKSAAKKAGCKVAKDKCYSRCN